MTDTRSPASSVALRTASTGKPRATGSTEEPAPGPQILVTRVGLQIPKDLSYEDWEKAGGKLARIASTSAWCLGDWIVHGQDRFADRYQYAVQKAGLDYQTLRNYVWVSRKIPQDHRHHQLSFQHHAEVASLDAAERDYWLRQAEASHWSRNELRMKIRAAIGRGGQRPKNATGLSGLSVTTEHVERWRAAAQLSCTSLERWLVETLNNAAAEALGDESPLDAPSADAPSSAT